MLKYGSHTTSRKHSLRAPSPRAHLLSLARSTTPRSPLPACPGSTRAIRPPSCPNFVAGRDTLESFPTCVRHAGQSYAKSKQHTRDITGGRAVCSGESTGTLHLVRIKVCGIQGLHRGLHLSSSARAAARSDLRLSCVVPSWMMAAVRASWD
jgi:hypothetical protein